MRQVVSCDEGYSFFIDKKGWVMYETGKHMTGQEIAEVLDISRSAVSQSLKRSLASIYRHLKIRNRNLNSFDLILIMADMFDIKTEVQYEKFFRLFDNRVKGEICRDAKGIYRN